MNLHRIWETLTGQPHEANNAGMVRAATTRLLRAVDDFEKRVVKPYSEADDPIDLLFEDIKRQREMAQGVTDGSKLRT